MFGLPGAFFSPMFHSPAISAQIFLQPGVLPSGPYLGLWLGVSAASPAVAAGILAVFPGYSAFSAAMALICLSSGVSLLYTF